MEGGGTRALVIGANGMLGGMVARVLDSSPGIEVIRATRRGGEGALAFDAARDPLDALLAAADCDWIVNAAGVLASRIDESDPASVAEAFAVNGAFPRRLAAAAGADRRVIAIATDGVFSGAGGPYDENARHDGEGAYARSKSEGEAPGPDVLELRCSIVGPETGPPASLLGWLLSQPPGAEVDGWQDQLWNGVTTLHFARLAEAVIAGRAAPPSPLHVIPADALSKAELLEAILAAFGRGDVRVAPRPAERPADRRLATVHPEENRRLWAATGYPEPPTIAAMLGELATFDR